ncbi:hypothetical protein TWF103_007658 [Orbilia oligospora]|nr:hypothetical protein TWF103_007658 [Orbilia oligospora]
MDLYLACLSMYHVPSRLRVPDGSNYELSGGDIPSIMIQKFSFIGSLQAYPCMCGTKDSQPMRGGPSSLTSLLASLRDLSD